MKKVRVEWKAEVQPPDGVWIGLIGTFDSEAAARSAIEAWRGVKGPFSGKPVRLICVEYYEVPL